jgi:hypothetical protein
MVKLKTCHMVLLANQRKDRPVEKAKSAKRNTHQRIALFLKTNPV